MLEVNTEGVTHDVSQELYLFWVGVFFLPKKMQANVQMTAMVCSYILSILYFHVLMYELEFEKTSFIHGREH